MLANTRITPTQFILKWQQRSYNSGDAADKAMKKYTKFLTSINETDDTILQKLGEIKTSPEFYLFLNRIVEYFGNELAPRSTNTYFSFVKDYFRKNGFRIYNEDIKQFVEFPKLQKEKKVPLLKDNIEFLANNASPYLCGVILALSSSGMRSSEFLQLEKSDIKWNLDPVEIHLRSEITKTKVDRVTYLTPQAAELFPKIKPYSEKYSLILLEQSFTKLRKKCNLDGLYRNSHIHHVTPHRLRAWFKTVTSDKHGKDYAEDLIGHEGYLSTYYSIGEIERAKKYKELVPDIVLNLK